jgi:Uma2 family endonuclease
MGLPRKKTAERFTWADYQTWPDDERWEIIGGEPFAMLPSPTSRHQRISGQLFLCLALHFRGKQCRPFAAPVDVKLSDEDVVQPDLLVVCNPRQIKRTHIEGAPRLVVEILSEHSVLHDRMRKTALYARAGVRELWLVTPFPSLVEVFQLQRGAYRLAAAYPKEQELVSPTFPDLKIKLADVFDFPLEPGLPQRSQIICS